MIARVRTSALHGVYGIPVDVEVEVRGGTPKFTIIGLGDGAIRESKDRVVAAIRASGFQMPGGPVLVSLAPAELKKEGSSFDIAIALGILAASHQLEPALLEKVSVHGELSLDGSIKGVRGVLPMAMAAKSSGQKVVCVPASHWAEVSLIKNIKVIGVESLPELCAILKGELSPGEPQFVSVAADHAGPKFEDVWGQERAKRALTIAAAGGHNTLLVGPPGCGKSMLADALRTILPPLEEDELLEVAKIHSAVGNPVAPFLSGNRPFRAPHHVVSDIGLVGGGSNPKPGEISLAHRGILFLDEFPEFRRSALEALRAPLETGRVRVVRASGSTEFPARFQLVAAMNPCPCGRLGVPGTHCLCSLPSVQQYLKKLSQPMLDRIDLHVELDPVPVSVLIGARDKVDKKSLVSEQVQCARRIQLSRQHKLNSELTGEEVRAQVQLSPQCQKLLERAGEKVGLSARGYMRVLRVAQTITDLEGRESVNTEAIAEALGFRALDRLSQYAQGISRAA